MNRPTVEKIGPTGQQAMAQRNRFQEENSALREHLREAMRLLGVIEATFRRVPLSTTSFDLNTVVDVRNLVGKVGGLV